MIRQCIGPAPRSSSTCVKNFHEVLRCRTLARRSLLRESTSACGADFDSRGTGYTSTDVETVPLRGATRLVPWRVRGFARSKTGWDRFRSLPSSDWRFAFSVHPHLRGELLVEVHIPSFGWGAWARSASTCVGTHLSYEGTRNGSDVDSSAYRLRLHGPPPLAWRRLRENSCDTGRLRVLVFPRECCNSLSRDTRPSARS